MPVTLEQLLAQPDFHLRLRAGAEPGSPALRAPLAWVHSSDLPDPTPWLSPGGLLLTDGTQFDSDGETAWADGYVGRLVAAEVAALGFATQVVHTEVPARLVDACGRHGLILVEVAERAPFMAIIAFVNDAAAREQRERLEGSLAAHRTIARAALRPDGLNAVLKELEVQLGCWVALFDAAGYRVPTQRDCRSRRRWSERSARRCVRRCPAAPAVACGSAAPVPTSRCRPSAGPASCTGCWPLARRHPSVVPNVIW